MDSNNRELIPGTVILTEKPFVYVLSSKFRTENCDFCFNKGELLKCSACQYVYYCGKVCQREGWSIHKHECKSLKRISPRVIPDAARLLGRLIKILQNGGDGKRSYYTEGSFRMFKDLMSHYSDLKDDKRRQEHFISLYGVLHEYMGASFLPNSAELMGMYGRMCINSFNISNQELQDLGSGIYLGASIIDHSCNPNAVATFEGTTIYIRTLETMKRLDFTQVFISYIDVMNFMHNRQEELERAYYFKCRCERCLDTESEALMSAAVCRNQNCEGFIDMRKESFCVTCGSKATEDFMENYKEVYGFSEMHLQNMKQMAYLDVCKVCLEKQKGVLYKFNVLHVKMLDLAFESSIDFGQWEDAKLFGYELIDGYKKWYGNVHPLLGLLHLKLGKILVYEGDTKGARSHLKESFNILKITHGISSSVFKELMPLLQQIALEC